LTSEIICYKKLLSQNNLCTEWGIKRRWFEML